MNSQAYERERDSTAHSSKIVIVKLSVANLLYDRDDTVRSNLVMIDNSGSAVRFFPARNPKSITSHKQLDKNFRDSFVN